MIGWYDVRSFKIQDGEYLWRVSLNGFNLAMRFRWYSAPGVYTELELLRPSASSPGYQAGQIALPSATDRFLLQVEARRYDATPDGQLAQYTAQEAPLDPSKAW